MVLNDLYGKNGLLLSSSPHIATPVTPARLMGNMLIALAPVSIFGIVIFGLPALLTIIAAVLAALAGECLFKLVTKQPLSIADLSASVTGLLLALVIPPSTPLWMTALGAFFAVVVAKEFFGGLGANVFNPALAGRAFLLMSFPAALTSWTQPGSGLDALSGVSAVEGVSGATPLAMFRHGEVSVEQISKAFFKMGLSGEDSYGSAIRTLFIGNHSGSIGEVSILLILAGFIYLIATKTIDWRAPAGMLGAAAILSFALGMDPLFSLLSGGLCFGAVFMATDYVTAPLTYNGRILFGIGAGIITILIRKWGSYPEGVTYSILIMNAFTPFLNRLLPKKYGFTAKKKAAAK
jgi:electron transport complex protein RnfD